MSLCTVGHRYLPTAQSCLEYCTAQTGPCSLLATRYMFDAHTNRDLDGLFQMAFQTGPSQPNQAKSMLNNAVDARTLPYLAHTDLEARILHVVNTCCIDGHRGRRNQNPTKTGYSGAEVTPPTRFPSRISCSCARSLPRPSVRDNTFIFHLTRQTHQRWPLRPIRRRITASEHLQRRI
jgi:hypothetical protein